MKTNKEKIKARNKEYYQANKEKLKAKKDKYREDNKEKIKARDKEYYQANKEYYQANKEYYQARNKEYYQANKEKITMKKYKDLTNEEMEKLILDAITLIQNKQEAHIQALTKMNEDLKLRAFVNGFEDFLNDIKIDEEDED